MEGVLAMDFSMTKNLKALIAVEDLSSNSEDNHRRTR